MKLSDYVKKFDKIEKELQAQEVHKLTADQSNIFRDVFKIYNHPNVRYAVLDAKSGSGKTTLIRAMQKYCKTNSIKLEVTATTGKASSALNGRTIHSYMGMKMTQNDGAETKEEALVLRAGESLDGDKPDILVIDESSMMGQKLFSEIDKNGFNFVFFVLDSSQLPPVKEKKVDWSMIADREYHLTKTLRAREPRMLKLFDDFREYKLGNKEELSLMDYVNDDNIVTIDYNDVDCLPSNTESCIVAYRNKLVEHFVDLSTSKEHSMYNLNRGVNVSLMIAEDDVPNKYGYFNRDFENEQVYYNGEDVEIIKLQAKTQELVNNGYCRVGRFKLSINKKNTGIVCVDTNNKIPFNAKESPEPKQFLKFPKDDILENCTLAIIEDKYFILLWDKSEVEFNVMLDRYFKKLYPYLKTMRGIKAYRKIPSIATLLKVPNYIQSNLKNMGRKEFNEWFKQQEESIDRSKAWANFLTASSVVSARQTTSRTIHKSQGISVPCVAISDMSFFGASKDAQYVAVTRCKHGLILITNTPEDWK